MIGEALNKAVHEEPVLDGRISGLREIINLRNVIVHGYAVVQNKTIWGLPEEDLLPLYREVKTLFE